MKRSESSQVSSHHRLTVLTISNILHHRVIEVAPKTASSPKFIVPIRSCCSIFHAFDNYIIMNNQHCSIVQNGLTTLNSSVIHPIDFCFLLTPWPLLCLPVVSTTMSYCCDCVCVTFSNWLVSSGNMPLCLLYVFSHPNAQEIFLLAPTNISQHVSITICLYIHLLKGAVVSSLWGILNKTTKNVCVGGGAGIVFKLFEKHRVTQFLDSNSKIISSFARSCQSIFQGDCVILHCNQQ